jgi:hypothetical protein
MFLRATALCDGYSGFGAGLLAGGLLQTTPRWFLRVVTRQPMDRSNRSPLLPCRLNRSTQHRR